MKSLFSKSLQFSKELIPGFTFHVKIKTEEAKGGGGLKLPSEVFPMDLTQNCNFQVILKP